MVGSAVWRELERRGFGELVGWPSSEVDLRDRDAAFDAIVSAAPDVLILAAAKVGGIWANASQPVEFLNDNLRIQTNVFEAALAACTDKLVFLGSSCVYPKFATQPIQEKELLSGPLEPTNAAYAIAKIAGIEGVRAYRERFGVHWISLMPCNIYGPYDNFDPENSHVLPALIRRFAEASHFETPEVRPQVKERSCTIRSAVSVWMSHASILPWPRTRNFVWRRSSRNVCLTDATSAWHSVMRAM
jgi:GDP-L-fucose synthase